MVVDNQMFLAVNCAFSWKASRVKSSHVNGDMGGILASPLDGLKMTSG